MSFPFTESPNRVSRSRVTAALDRPHRYVDELRNKVLKYNR